MSLASKESLWDFLAQVHRDLVGWALVGSIRVPGPAGLERSGQLGFGLLGPCPWPFWLRSIKTWSARGPGSSLCAKTPFGPFWLRSMKTWSLLWSPRYVPWRFLAQVHKDLFGRLGPSPSPSLCPKVGSFWRRFIKTWSVGLWSARSVSLAFGSGPQRPGVPGFLARPFWPFGSGP